MGREAGELGLRNVGGGHLPMPGPLYSAPSCTGRPRGRGPGLAHGRPSKVSEILGDYRIQAPHHCLQCPHGETEALRGKEDCLRLHSRACPGRRQGELEWWT